MNGVALQRERVDSSDFVFDIYRRDDNNDVIDVEHAPRVEFVTEWDFSIDISRLTLRTAKR